MKIVLLTDGGNGKFGGSDVYVAQLARALYEVGHQPSIAALYPGKAAEEMYKQCSDIVEIFHVVPNFSLEQILPKRHIFREIRKKFVVQPNFLSSTHLWFKVRDLRRWLKKVKPDIGHIHWAGGIPMSVIAIRALQQCHIPVIETLHAAPPGVGRYSVELMQLRSGRGKKIVAVSEATLRSLNRMYDRDAPPCTVLYCGVNERLLKQRAALPLVDSQNKAVDSSLFKSPKILIVGHVNEQKGVKILIEAANILKIRKREFSVWIVGDGHLRQRLQEYVLQLGLQEFIYFSGHVSNPAPWFANADIYAQCSTESEGLPLGICDALALGVPVVATDIGGISEAIVNEKTGLLIAPKSPEQLSQALEKLIDNQELRTTLIKNGRELVQRSFSFDLTVNTYVALYKEMASANFISSPLIFDHRLL